MREKFNSHLHSLYVRQDFESCLRCIESVLSECKGMSEYPVYVKALIKRQRGEIQESMQLFQAATCLNPQNVCNLKQVGRSLYLLGKHKAALDVYAEAQRLGIDDWEIWHNKGLCNMYLKQYEMAADCFRRANAVQRHDTTYMQLGKVFTLQEDYRGAIDVYLEALEFSPENPELLTTLGLIYLRLGENYKAFDFLGNSLTHDPKNPKTILAAGSIIQVRCSAACRKSAHAAHAARARARARAGPLGHGCCARQVPRRRCADAQLGTTLEQHWDVLLRQAAVRRQPRSAALPRRYPARLGAARRYVAAIACLKRALYLDPFEWIISYNLGLVHLNTGQYASSFHYFSTSINLKPDCASRPPSAQDARPARLRPRRFGPAAARAPPAQSRRRTCTSRSRSTGWTTSRTRALRMRRRSTWKQTTCLSSTTPSPSTTTMSSPGCALAQPEPERRGTPAVPRAQP